MEGTTAQQAREQVQDTAQQAGEQVREKAQEAGEQARGRLQQEVDARSTQAGEQIGSTAETIRRVSQSLREEGQDGPARTAEQAADRVDRAARWLRESDSERIVRDVERFGRERPWAFALGGLALGFAAARFVKASSGERYRSETSSPARTGGNGHRPDGFAELPGTSPVEATPPTATLDPPAAG